MGRHVIIDAMDPITPPRRSYSELERDEIVRQTLEEAARRIEGRQGNAVYKSAWRTAAVLLRAMKP